MKKIGLFLLAFMIILSLDGQTVRVVLKSRVNMMNAQFDSIQIRNIRTNQKITKFFPDSILSTSTVGVEDYENQNSTFDLSLHAQNPFYGSTQVVLNTVLIQPVTLSLYDVSGRLCFENTYNIEPGIHRFSVAPPVEGFYILQARTKSNKISVKLIQAGTGNQMSMISWLNSDLNIAEPSLNNSIDKNTFFVIGDSLDFTCWKNGNTKSGVVKMNQNGSLYFNIFPIITGTFSLRGTWRTLPMNYNFEPHITTVTTIPYENYVYFRSDTLLSTYRALPFNYNYSSWDYFTEVGQITYYLYRLEGSGFYIPISNNEMMFISYSVYIFTNYYLRVVGSMVMKSDLNDKNEGGYDYFIKAP